MRDRALPERRRTALHAASRREIFRAAGLALAGAAAGIQASPSRAADPPPEPPPAMRSPRHRRTASQGGGPPARPELGVIVLNRLAFGPRPGDLDAFRALGADDLTRLGNWVDAQLAPETIDDSSFEARLAGYGLTTLSKSLAQLWADHTQSQEAQSWKYRTLPFQETEKATFLRAIYSERQLVEVLADFWHNHFNVYGYEYWTAPVFVHYDRDVIRGHMLGNFREMLGAVARSPAMLYYLDNQSNSGGNPNENYARELFELHTMGAENYLGVRAADSVPTDDQGRPVGYVDADVYGATTCFTGWRVDRDTGLFQFSAEDHFPYQKVVLRRIIEPFLGERDGEIVLDLLAEHPGTARHIARKLCTRLVADSPPEALVQEAAEVFHRQRNAPDQLKQVVRTIVLSEAFRTTWGQKVKRPFEFTVSVLRATQTDFDPMDEHFFWVYDVMGQPLFQWPPPNGYPDTREAWTSTMPMLQRWRMVNWLMEWEVEGDEGRRRLPIQGIMPGNVRTPEQIVDWWSHRLLGYTLPPNERGPIVDFMAYGRAPDADLPPDQVDERLRYAVALILMAPSFQWR